MKKSRLALLVSILFILAVHFFYQPRWKKHGLHATIAFDVFGYYRYLPAFFIYGDAKTAASKDEVYKKYQPFVVYDASYLHEASGNQVMKYPIGKAVQFAPFFAVAHFWAKNSARYEADGYSFPYQFLISMGSLLIAIIGLIYLRRVLLIYFGETETAVALLLIVFGTNYLNYSAIGGAMSHNNLFTISALLIYLSIHFHRNPSLFRALCIGALLGIAALTRPTEILMALIPILWGLSIFESGALKKRLQFFQYHWKKMASAVLLCVAIGSIQLFYWKWATGEWFVYSYQDQGFSWLKPHLKNGFISYKAGWLTYSPVMVFSLLGYFFLKSRAKSIFAACLIYTALHIYITFAWDIWWYGGSLGQRAMVQAYPILAFPLAAFVKRLGESKRIVLGLGAAIILLFTYLNLWFTHQAHHGGLMHVSQMTGAYYWKSLGRYELDRDYQKLLDTNQYFEGTRKNIQALPLFERRKNGTRQEIGPKYKSAITFEDRFRNFEIDLSSEDEFPWIRVSGEFYCDQKEWSVWSKAQLAVQFHKDGKFIKEKVIRLHRLLDPKQSKEIFFDVKKTDQEFDKVVVVVRNVGSKHSLNFNNLKAETFTP